MRGAQKLGASDEVVAECLRGLMSWRASRDQLSMDARGWSGEMQWKQGIDGRAQLNRNSENGVRKLDGHVPRGNFFREGNTDDSLTC